MIAQGVDADKLPWYGLAFVGLAAFEGLMSYLRGVWSARTAEGITLRLRNYLFDHVQRLPFAYHDHAKTGELIQRATSDVDTLRRFYADQAIGIGRIVALFAVNLAMLLRLNWQLGLLSVVIMPVVVACRSFFLARSPRRTSVSGAGGGALDQAPREPDRRARGARLCAPGARDGGL